MHCGHCRASIARAPQNGRHVLCTKCSYINCRFCQTCPKFPCTEPTCNCVCNKCKSDKCSGACKIQVLDARDIEIQRLMAENADIFVQSDEEINRLNTIIAEIAEELEAKDEIIDHLENEIEMFKESQKNQIEIQLMSQLAAKDKQVMELEQQIIQMSSRIEKQNSKIDELEIKLSVGK